MYKEIEVNKLKEHPKNHKQFPDIKEQSYELWEAFKENIEQYGVIEPLVVNQNTMEIISGNQRYHACKELGINKVHCILMKPESEDVEEALLIASNVMRRNEDQFTKMKKIKELRKENIKRNSSSLKDEIYKIFKSSKDVQAADIFNALPAEKQQELKQWFHSEDHTLKELRERIQEYEEIETGLQAQVQELEDRASKAEEFEDRYNEMLEERKAEIAELQEELENAQDEDVVELKEEIKKLERANKKLKDKVDELKQPPDIASYLEACITRQADTNAVLKEILDNKDYLNEARMKRLFELVFKTFRLMKERANKAEMKLITEGNND
jgi:ParB-like chromosome segregation protein Spo0J